MPISCLLLIMYNLQALLLGLTVTASGPGQRSQGWGCVGLTMLMCQACVTELRLDITENFSRALAAI